MKLILFAILGAVGVNQTSHPTSDPKSFLEDVYSHYADSNNADSSINLENERYFSRPLVLLRANNVRALRGNLGALDADPVCDCIVAAPPDASSHSNPSPNRCCARNGLPLLKTA